jgi:hypothetical protein
MALMKTVKTNFDVEIKDAYHRIENVTLTKKDKMSFRLRSYKDASSAVAFADAGFDSEYKIDGSNPIAQAYGFLKSLKEFEDFVDC